MRDHGVLILAGLLILAAVVYLIIGSTNSTAHFFLTIEELQASDTAQGRNVTVSGAVLGETIVYDEMAPRVTFTMVQIPADPQEIERRGGLAQVLRDAVLNPNAARLEVVYDGVKPDLLTREAQAIVRGRLGDDGRFYADELLLKCPSRYEDEIPNQPPSGRPIGELSSRQIGKLQFANLHAHDEDSPAHRRLLAPRSLFGRVA